MKNNNVEAKMNSANLAVTQKPPINGSNGTSSPTKESRSSNQTSPTNGGNPFGESEEWEEEDSEGEFTEDHWILEIPLNLCSRSRERKSREGSREGTGG